MWIQIATVTWCLERFPESSWIPRKSRRTCPRNQVEELYLELRMTTRSWAHYVWMHEPLFLHATQRQSSIEFENLWLLDTFYWKNKFKSSRPFAMIKFSLNWMRSHNLSYTQARQLLPWSTDIKLLLGLSAAIKNEKFCNYAITRIAPDSFRWRKFVDFSSFGKYILRNSFRLSCASGILVVIFKYEKPMSGGFENCHDLSPWFGLKWRLFGRFKKLLSAFKFVLEPAGFSSESWASFRQIAKFCVFQSLPLFISVVSRYLQFLHRSGKFLEWSLSSNYYFFWT